ncbi:MAG: Gx transporter family protein [Spirochaetales bacterium]|nr:Gx transporter family protein [Spirochaetales bacterium]
MKIQLTDKRLDLIAFFGAVSMFFAAVEFLFPKPVPWMRLGIANIPILLALGIFDLKELLLLASIKVIGQGIINGTLASHVFLFSAAGTFSSTLVMFGLKKLLKHRVSLLGISIAGAFVSNSVQTFLSLAIIFEKEAWIIIPYFMGSGFIASIIVGLFANQVSEKSVWFAELRKREEQPYGS